MNVTFTANETLIRKARAKAKRRKTSLNRVFGEWLRNFADQEETARDFDALMDRLKDKDAGSKFDREQMNER